MNTAKLKKKLSVEKNQCPKKSKKSNGKEEHKNANDTDPISYDNIKYIFMENTTFNEQFKEFLDKVQVNNTALQTSCEYVCKQLQNVLKRIFPKCQLYKFGSTQTGLGLKGCDLDIYIDIGVPVCEEESASPDSWTMPKIFKRVRKLMYTRNQVFSHIVTIPKAKTPIIKFCHVPTNIFSDISFDNRMGVHKSYFINHCILLDNRIKPLIILIKYWARHINISKSRRLSSYALLLLILFYLQQPSVNIFPPVMELQKNSTPLMVKGWQVNLDENPTLPSVTNEYTIPQLLHGFFSFYASFDFKSYVVCPLDGLAHPETNFKEVDSLPQCMSRYKKYVKMDESMYKFDIEKPMRVQDPIELSHNVTGHVQLPGLEFFVKQCSVDAEDCASTSKNDYQNLMITLFSKKPKTVPKKSTNVFRITFSSARFKNGFPLQKKRNVCTYSTKGFDIEGNWSSTIFNIMRDIFEKIFKLQVDVPARDIQEKQETDTIPEVDTKEDQTIIVHCKGKYITLCNRNITNAPFDPSLSRLEKEELISNQMVENIMKRGAVSEEWLNFTCSFRSSSDEIVILKLNNKDSEPGRFQEFTRFLSNNLRDIVYQTLAYIQTTI